MLVGLEVSQELGSAWLGGGPKWRLTKRCLECVMLLFSSGEKWAQMAQQGHPSFWDPQFPLVDPKLLQCRQGSFGK